MPGEVRTRIVVVLTTATMILEIVAGIFYGSMALLADGGPGGGAGGASDATVTTATAGLRGKHLLCALAASTHSSRWLSKARVS